VRFAAQSSRLLAAGKRTRAAAVQQDGGQFVVWNTNDRSRVLAGQRPLVIDDADIAPDGSLVATIEHGETVVRLWHVPDGRAAGELAGHGGAVTTVRFARDGQSLLTACRDGIARVFGRDGTLRHELRTGTSLERAAWSRDSSLVLTSSRGDAESVLWRIDGSELLRFRGHRGPLESGVFRPDGSAVATAASDGTICIWPTDPVARARRLLPATAPPASSPPPATK
jgi:WD40 repeat protein